ncbi:LytR C-terminal domain-containing protein [Bifidobacterium sp. AGR2158]|uniref:LytR C-terminal domain-containing protein n=1 Tax=Bifidobacterium sp. AGR2158 TaxID=1280675 RepID=UPI000421051E|nr:LytR C-terminal domain-containing protein [Bifidobacterium sp. AGR2158]
MARKDSEGYDSYPKDAYDDPPQGPVGVHRGARSLGVRLTPFVIVIIAAVAAGVLFWSIFSGEAANLLRGRVSSSSISSAQVAQTTTAAAPSESSSESASASESASPAGSTSPSESASPSESSEAPTPEESQQVNKAAAISVVNGTTREGYASTEAQKLVADGYPNATPMNPGDMALPGQTVVWYQNDADLATAQAVASTLGIATIEQAPGIGAPIVVVLMQ